MRKSYFYALISFILLGFLIYLSSILFPEGYIYHTDVTESLTVTELYKRYIYTYSNDIGESLAETARIPLFYFIYGTYKLLTVTGLDDSFYVKLKIYLLISSTLGTYILVAYKLLEFIKHKNDGHEQDSHGKHVKIDLPVLIGAVMGGLYYVLNYWATNRIVHFYLFFSSVSVPITFYFLYTYLFSVKTGIKKLIFLAILLSVFSPTPHTVLFEALIISVIYIAFISRRYIDKSIKVTRTMQLLLFGVFYILLNTYWILPYLVSLSVPDAILSETIVNLIGRYATLNNSIRLMGYWLVHPKEYYLEQFRTIQFILSYVPPLLSLTAIYLLRKKHHLSLIIMLLLVSGILLATASSFTNMFYFYIMFNSPLKMFGWVFREYDKFGLIISFVYSLSISLVLYLTYKKKLIFFPTLALIAAVLVSNAYFFNKELVKRYSPEIIPEEFRVVTEMIKQDPEEFNVAWYPGVPNPFWAKNEDVRYTFSNLISSKPAVTTHSSIINYLNYLMDNGNIHYINVGKALDSVGVKYLVIRKDESVFDNFDLEGNLDLQTSLQKLSETGLLTVYLNKEYTGLVNFYRYKISTNYGLEALKNPKELSLNPRTTFIDYTDKPSETKLIPVSYDLSPNNTIDGVIDRFENKFIFPFRHTTKKDDGNAGYWKLGSLEDLNHAETKFFFSNLGLDINQFDYKEGVVVARDGWRKTGGISGFNNVDKDIFLTFSKHPNMINEDRNYYYLSDPEDFKYYWNIIRSDKFDVAKTKALEITLGSNIDPALVPHYKVYTYDESENVTGTVFIYPNERNNIDGIVKIPEGSKYADFSIWALSDQQLNYDYDLYDVAVRDISEHVAAPSLSFKQDVQCDRECYVLARVLVSKIGGRMGLRIGQTTFEYNTGETEKDRFKWVELGKLNNVNGGTEFELINYTGFNAVNALLILETSEYSQLLGGVRTVNSGMDREPDFTRIYPDITVKQINPTRYEFNVRGAGAVTGVVSFAKPFNKNWELVGLEQEPVVINGYVNGWEIPELTDGDYVIEYKPQRYFYFGSIVSLLTLGGLVFYLIEAKLVRVSVRRSKSHG